MSRPPSGFTLIEMLVVVVVLGILAAIAIPKYSSMRTKSYVAAVTSDLKNVASQQEIHLSNTHVYATAVADLDFTLSEAVTVTINEATGTGWAATATHQGLSGQECGFYFGDADPANAGPATVPGTVLCN